VYKVNTTCKLCTNTTGGPPVGPLGVVILLFGPIILLLLFNNLKQSKADKIGHGDDDADFEDSDEESRLHKVRSV